MLTSLDINTEDIAINENLFEFPLWDTIPPKCLTHISNFEKSNTLPQFYQDRFYLTKYRFSDYKCIYTDGSKRGNKVAFAFVTPLFTTAQRIPDGCSIFTAEAIAIFRSLQYVKTSKFRKFILFSDSLSLIQTIESQNSRNSIVISILKLIAEINELDKIILFCWIPSHCGIPGNERADRAAKDALNQDITPMLIPFVDKIPFIKLAIRQSWQQDWDNEINNKLHKIKPQLGSPLIVNSCRKDQVVLNRIRIGHSRLSHSFLMEQRNGARPRCHYCHANKPLTVRHVMIKCPHFNATRLKYFNVRNLKSLFDTVSAKDIICYLKETSLYQEI